MIDKTLVEKLANERIQERNPKLYIVEISISTSNHISVEIDNESDRVSIEDCISVSRNIEHNLDREVEDFSLEVASAGLDRPLRVLKQYIRHKGKKVKVKAKNGVYEGVLKDVNENEITLSISEKRKIEGKKKKELVEEDIIIPFSEINETKIIITF